METLSELGFRRNGESIHNITMLEVLYSEKNKEDEVVYYRVDFNSLKEDFLQIVESYNMTKSIFDNVSSCVEDPKDHYFKSLKKYGSISFYDFKNKRFIEFTLYKFTDIKSWKTKYKKNIN